MLKKHIISLVVIVAVCTGVYFVGLSVSNGQARLPEVITQDTLCPVAGCVDSDCHAGDEAPSPDGVFEMICPKIGCASVECHAWDRIVGLNTSFSAQDASLNLWILVPVLLITALVFFVTKFSKSDNDARGHDGSREGYEEGNGEEDSNESKDEGDEK